MYKKILVPIDGSETSTRGLSEAIEIAKGGGGQLCLVHVVNELILDYSYGARDYGSSVVDSLREVGNAILKQAEETVRKSGLSVQSVLLECVGGPAADSIVKQASEWHADLIVMGTHGRRGIRRFAMGSDAESVVRESPVPVLLVRQAAKSDAGKGALA
jgi:nucleotide-binding universal stress UspA family protein